MQTAGKVTGKMSSRVQSLTLDHEQSCIANCVQHVDALVERDGTSLVGTLHPTSTDTRRLTNWQALILRAEKLPFLLLHNSASSHSIMVDAKWWKTVSPNPQLLDLTLTSPLLFRPQSTRYTLQASATAMGQPDHRPYCYMKLTSPLRYQQATAPVTSKA